MKMNIVDLHCDTITGRVARSAGRHHLLRNDPGKCHVDLERLQIGGSLLQCFAIFMFPSHEWHLFDAQFNDNYDFFEYVYSWYLRELESNKNILAPVHCYVDVESNIKAGKISAMLTVEDGVALDGKIERVDDFYNKGVRMIALTWNYENSLGIPNTVDPLGGLKPFGIEALARMNELGIIADVSHLSDAGFYDVAKYSTKPFVASHSNARALCPIMRNLTDDMLRVLGASGGVAGINFAADFLVENAKYTTIADIVRHAKHIANKAGIEAVALGSDFDGISCKLEFSDCAGMQKIVDALHGEFSSREVDMITHENALRCICDCIA